MNPEKRNPSEFYSSIATAEKYVQEAERFVPGYRQIISGTIDGVLSVPTLAEYRPIKIVDLGSGPGHVSQAILRESDKSFAKVSKVYCVDSEPGMIEAARGTLSEYSDKAVFSAQNALEFEPEEAVDVVFSNLMLHNLPLQDKITLINRIKGWLKPKGRLIWTDFVKFADENLWDIEMENRKKIALAMGADLEFVETNFRKERQDDYPITPEQMKEIMESSGFIRVREVWRNSTFSRVTGDKE